MHPAGGGLREGGEGGQQPGGGGEGGRLRLRHRTRMYTEQTAKVVAAALGGGGDIMDSIPCRASYWKNRIKSSYSSNRPGANHPILPIVRAKIFLFFESSW